MSSSQEGILKFVYTNQGFGRFAKLGIPAPEISSSFVASLEIVGGLMLIAGLFTRAIAVPFIIEMVVAILTTKISLYQGTSPLPLPPALPKVGFWAVMHESRSDYAQILTLDLLARRGPWALVGRRPATPSARACGASAGGRRTSGLAGPGLASVKSLRDAPLPGRPGGTGRCTAGAFFSNEGARVVPGNASQSLLFQKISDQGPPCGAPMPLGAAPLLEPQIMLVEAWINGRALDD